MKKFFWSGLLLAAVLAVASYGAARATFSDTATSKSNSFTATTLAAPTLTSATVGADGETVTLAWAASSSTWASGYKPLRGTTSGSWPNALPAVSGVNSTTTTNVAPSGVTQYYVVQSYYQNWTSTPSNQQSASPLASFNITNPSTATTGTPVSVTVAAINAAGSPLANFTGQVTLTASGGGMTCSPSCTVALSGGSATYSVTFASPATPVTLTATYSTFPSGGYQVMSNGTTTMTVTTAVQTSPIYVTKDKNNLTQSVPGAGTFGLNHGANISPQSNPAAPKAGSVKQVAAGSWALNLVINKTSNTTAATVSATVWWQNTSCAASPVGIPTSQLIASVSGAQFGGWSNIDHYGVSIPLSATGNSHLMVAGDVLCLYVSNDGPTPANDFQVEAGTLSTAGTAGLISGLTGPITFN